MGRPRKWNPRTKAEKVGMENVPMTPEERDIREYVTFCRYNGIPLGVDALLRYIKSQEESSLDPVAIANRADKLRNLTKENVEKRISALRLTSQIAALRRKKDCHRGTP